MRYEQKFLALLKFKLPLWIHIQFQPLWFGVSPINTITENQVCKSADLRRSRRPAYSSEYT